MKKYEHESVLLNEVIKYLDPKQGKNYVDCTLGGAGHAKELLKRTAPNGKLIGIDLDPRAISHSKKVLKEFGSRAIIVHDSYINIKEIANKHNLENIHGILLDLGVSSSQLEDDTFGFSFQKKGPLIMTFSGRKHGLTAERVVNTFTREKLEEIIKTYGEERYARRIVNNIIAYRKKQPIKTTSMLVRAICDAVPKYKQSRIHPATRTFQALRIFVNDELENIRNVIPDALSVLSKGGRLAVIAFHSLEDKIVKNVFRNAFKNCICPPNFPVCACSHRKSIRFVTKKAVTPSMEEIQINPRARSARIRVVERI